MEIITYEEVTPTLIENTSMQKVFRDGVHSTYYITPILGYVLHDCAFDTMDYDENGNETGVVELGYRTTTASCAASYDFMANPREFYSVLSDSIPADQIFGDASNYVSAN